MKKKKGEVMHGTDSTQIEKNNYSPVMYSREETIEVKEKARFVKLIYDMDDERELELMLKASDMQGILWNLVNGLGRMLRGKSNTYFHVQRYATDTIEGKGQKERPMETVLEETLQYILTECGERGITLE